MAKVLRQGGRVSDAHLHDNSQLQNGDRNDSYNTVHGNLHRNHSEENYSGSVRGSVSHDKYEGHVERNISRDNISRSTVYNYYGAFGSSVDISTPSLSQTSDFSDPSNALVPRGFSKNRYFDVPHPPDENFTGRTVELERLEGLLPTINASQPGARRFILHGLGGSGKTQICLKFAQEYRSRFWGVFWVDASTHESIKRGLTQITPFKKDNNVGFNLDQNNSDDDLELESNDSASALNEEWSLKRDIAKMTGTHGLAKKHDAPCGANVERVLNTLSAVTGPWLIIFDNADDDELKLDSYTPMSEYGSILVTTRNDHFEMKGGAETVNVTSLGAEDAVEVFRKARKVEHDQWKAKSKKYLESVRSLVMEQLGGLPLAINQAATLMRKKSIEPAQYRKRFEEKRAELLNDTDTMANNTYHLPVWSTWEISVDAISEKATDQSRDALELLYLFACLDHRHVPQRLFRRAWKRVNNGMVAEEWISKMTGGKEWFKIHQPDVFRIGREDESWGNIEERFDDAMELLTSYSLVTVKSSEDVRRKSDRDAADRWIYMHPLVHTWAYDRLENKTREKSLTVATFMTCLSASAPYLGGRDQVDWLFRDLAHNLERLAARFIEHKTKYNASFTKEQINIVRGLWASLVITLQWGKARNLRKELLGSATQFVVSRAKSGTNATVKYIKKYGSSPNLKGKSFSPSLRGSRSPSPSPNVGSKGPQPLGHDGFGEPIPLATTPIEEEPLAEAEEANADPFGSRGSCSSLKNRAKLGTTALMRKTSPYLRSKASSQFQVEEDGGELSLKNEADGKGVAINEEAAPGETKQDASMVESEERASRRISHAEVEPTAFLRKTSPHARCHSAERGLRDQGGDASRQPSAQEDSPRAVSIEGLGLGESRLADTAVDRTLPPDDSNTTENGAVKLDLREESESQASAAKLSRMQRALMQCKKQEATALLKKRLARSKSKTTVISQHDGVSEDISTPPLDGNQCVLAQDDTASAAEDDSLQKKELAGSGVA